MGKTMTAQGWECPKCGAINAPWALQCPCSRPKRGVSDEGKNIWERDDTGSSTITFNEVPDWNEED